MKSLFALCLITAAMLQGCAIDARTGKRVYAGPPITLGACRDVDGVKVCASYSTADGVRIEANEGFKK